MGDKGLYVVIEGPDGSGKSIQAAKIIEKLKDKGFPTVHFREPGGEIGKEDTIGEKIRALLQDNNNAILPMCELALFTANRAQLIEQIKTYLDKGTTVVCERSFLSSIVYQGYGRNIDIDIILQATRLFVDKLPDLAVIYNVDVHCGNTRVAKRGEKDRIENEDFSFHARVCEGYRCLGKVCEQLGIPYIAFNTEEQQWEKYVEKAVYEITKKIQRKP